MKTSSRTRPGLARNRASLVLTLAAISALAGCDCDGGPSTNQAGGRVSFEREAVDFGYVIVGQQKEVTFKVQNTGRGVLTVRNIERAPAPGHDKFPDEIRFTPPRMTLEPGDEATLTLFFEPIAEGLAEGLLLLRNDSAEETVELRVRGIGVKTDIRVTPAEVDFGPTILQDVGARTARLENKGAGPVSVLLEPINGDHAAFFFRSVPGADQALVKLEPEEGIDLDLTFRPGSVGPATAQFNVRACAGCAPVLVTLAGRGVAAGIIAEPESLDFGPVLPNTTATKTLRFRNIGNRRIAITSCRPPGSVVGSKFGAVFAPGGWPTLDPAQAADVTVSYSPTGLGPDLSRLIVETDDPRAPSFDVNVQGYGGGPDVQLTPQALDFGKVAIGYPITRRLTIGNRGINDTSSDADDLLVSAIELPPGTEFSWSIPGGGGLPLRVAPGTRKTIDVTYDPIDPDDLATPAVNEGADFSEIRLTLNDADTPLAAVPLQGEGRHVPPCDAELLPAPSPGLQFGVVARGRTSRLSFSLRNVGVADCIIGKIDLAADASPAFTLPGGPVYGKILSPTDGRLITEIEFGPPGTTPSGTNFAGILEIDLSARPSEAHRRLELTGRGAEVCLSITPAGFDFGIVEPQCETSDRTFTIYNACRTVVKIDRIELNLGAGEFRVLAPPGLPRALQPQQDLRFNVRYKPGDLGQDQGTVEVYTDQSGVTGGAPYVLTLAGTGDTDASMVETFRQADKARADILFVVDDSGSMSEEQATLGREFQSFMRFAQSQQIDYHLAVTTTSTCDSSSANGKIVPTGSQSRIVSPALADPERAFTDNVNVGTDGCADETGLEAAYLALSDPNINGPNAGFLRPDAYLSIIIVSDEEDSSARTLDFYTNFFQNLKGPRGANLVSVSGIVGTENPDCEGPGGSADYGQRYIETARRTSGITESICNETWSVALQKLGLIAFGYKSRFILASEPDPATLRIFIDGTQVPAGPLWAYTPEANAIDFLPIAVPPAGSEIRVEYAVACH